MNIPRVLQLDDKPLLVDDSFFVKRNQKRHCKNRHKSKTQYQYHKSHYNSKKQLKRKKLEGQKRKQTIKRKAAIDIKYVSWDKIAASRDIFVDEDQDDQQMLKRQYQYYCQSQEDYYNDVYQDRYRHYQIYNDYESYNCYDDYGDYEYYDSYYDYNSYGGDSYTYNGLRFGQYGDSSYPWWNPTGLGTWERQMYDFD